MNAIHGRSDSILEPPSSERSGSIDCQDAPELLLNVPMALMAWQKVTLIFEQDSQKVFR